jgi:hypothetical protein
VWIGLIWLPIGSNGGLLRTGESAFGFHKMLGFIDLLSKCKLLKKFSAPFSLLVSSLVFMFVF